MVAEEKHAALPSERYEDLLESLTELGRTLAEDESVQETLGSILTLATRLVPGCHAASVTVLDDDGKPATVAATDAEQEEMDRRQYLLHDGPCMDAARRQQINNWSLAEAEQRWPDFTALATDMGLRSYLAAGLGLGSQRLGALNLSSRGEDGFDRLDEGTGRAVRPARLGRDRDRQPVPAGPGTGRPAQPGAVLPGRHRPRHRDHHGRVEVPG